MIKSRWDFAGLFNFCLPIIYCFRIFFKVSPAALVIISRIFESFVIIATSLHQDYALFYPSRQIKTIGEGIQIGLELVLISCLSQKLVIRFSSK